MNSLLHIPLLLCSLPAPLFYTTDNIPDLMIRSNIGAWPEYNRSTIRILDGTDGSLLWTFNSTQSGMMSAVSVVSQTHGRDALLFLAVGVVGEDTEGRDKRSESHPLDEGVRDQATAYEGLGSIEYLHTISTYNMALSKLKQSP